MNTTLVNVLTEVVYIIAIIIIPIVAKYVILLLTSKKNEISSNIERNEFQDTEWKCIDIVQKVVDTVSQTYVDSLKSAGKFTKEAQSNAFNKALELSKKLISDESKDLLSTVYSDIDSWIGVQIESYIKNIKK